MLSKAEFIWSKIQQKNHNIFLGFSNEQKVKKKQPLFEIETGCNNINIFTVTFD